MSDAPDRRIGGLAPRGPAPDLSILQRKNRRPPVSVTAEPAGVDTPPPAVEALSDVQDAEPQPIVGTRSTAAKAGQVRQTIYLGAQLRDRARAAFRATQHAEGDRSWSEFVETAIRAETERREVRHNGGTPYTPDSVPLRPGRPLDG